MNWQIEISRDARKELAALPEQIQIRLAKSILALENNPYPHGAKKLKNRDGWRIRVGDYRVLYFVDGKTKHLVIGNIGHRREIYR